MFLFFFFLVFFFQAEDGIRDRSPSRGLGDVYKRQRKENSGEAILPDIAKTILDKIAERKLDKEEIDGVGIGVPGPVNERGEVPCAVNLFWGFKEVTKELTCLLYTSPSPRDGLLSRMPSSA